MYNGPVARRASSDRATRPERRSIQRAVASDRMRRNTASRKTRNDVRRQVEECASRQVDDDTGIIDAWNAELRRYHWDRHWRREIVSSPNPPPNQMRGRAFGRARAGLLREPDHITASSAASEQAVYRGLPEPGPGWIWPYGEVWPARAACLRRAVRDWLSPAVWPVAWPWRRS